MPSWQVSRCGRLAWEISLSSRRTGAGRCGLLPSSRHRRGSCREGRRMCATEASWLARIRSWWQASSDVDAACYAWQSGRSRATIDQVGRRLGRWPRLRDSQEPGGDSSCPATAYAVTPAQAPIGWKQSQQNRPVIEFGPAERLPPHSERSGSFTKVLCLQCRHRAVASDCDSHPKMLYRVTAIYRSVTEADVFSPLTVVFPPLTVIKMQN
jgi:hypothetical protein